MNKPLTFSDAEIYPDWACFVFKYEGVHYQYQHNDRIKLSYHDVGFFLENCTIVGFNYIKYDQIMLLMMLQGASNAELHDTSYDIIVNKKSPWQIMKDKQLLSVLDFPLDIIDIMPVLKGKASMKLYGARVHFKKLQELPFDPMLNTTAQDRRILLGYCNNDCDVTEELYYEVEDEIALRITMSKTYQMDLRSESGPGIAAKVLSHEYERITGKATFVPRIGKEVPTVMQYQCPDWISFRTLKFQKILDEIKADTFKLNTNTGHLILGNSVKDRVIALEDRSVKLGIGGLHSIDSPGYYKATTEQCIVDFDAASHYPSMILNSGWFPTHLGPEFLAVYRTIVELRLKAKAEGDKTVAEALKLVINVSFGLFSMMYGPLYAPNLLLNVTLSGQLSLLMLAERFEAAGHYIISANTDGIVVNPPRSAMAELKGIVAEFERDTGLTMEDTWYSTYVRRDVNNYFTIIGE